MAIIAFASIQVESSTVGELYLRVHVACEGGNKWFDYKVDPPGAPIDPAAIIAKVKWFIEKHGKHFKHRKVGADQIRLFIPNEVTG